MIRKWTLILCWFALTSCALPPSFIRVSYDATFTMATCGNILNPNIYQPDTGPEGFVSFRSLFTKGFELKLERNFTCVFAFQVKNGELTRYSGTYVSQSTNAGSLHLRFANKELTLIWPNYYQLVFECDIKNPDNGETLHTVALLHSSNIFST